MFRNIVNVSTLPMVSSQPADLIRGLLLLSRYQASVCGHLKSELFKENVKTAQWSDFMMSVLVICPLLPHYQGFLMVPWKNSDWKKEQRRFAVEAQAPVRTPVESSIFIASTLPFHRLRSALADPSVSRSWDLQSPVPQPLQLSPWIMGSIGRVWSSAVDHGFYYCKVLSFASFKISALKSTLLTTR